MTISMSDLYVSRTDRGAAIIARQDPVVYEGGAYADALDAEQVSRYNSDGFILLENLFSEQEVEGLLDEVKRMSVDPAISSKDEAIREPGSDAVRSLSVLIDTNRAQLDAILDDLHPVLETVDRNLPELNSALAVLGPAFYGQSLAGTHGPWLDIYVAALGPDIFGILEELLP